MTAETVDRRAKWIAVAMVVVACLPILVATVRAIAHHWVPLGDDGLLALRVQDVFSRHIPLLGSASSASFAAPKPLNNAGALYPDLLSIPVWVLGSAVGTAIGVAVVNIAAVSVIGTIAWRRAGLVGVALATLVTGVLAWSMGSELLYDIWQPHALLIPFLAFLFTIWAVVAADFAILPLAVFVGSLLMQTHLTYGYLTPALLVTALAGGWWHGRSTDPRPRSGFWILVAVVVGVVAWTQPLIEQVTTRDGNMSRLVQQIQDPPKQVVGGDGALRLTATVLTHPPFWFRDSFGDTFRPPGTPYGSTASTIDGTGAVGIGAALVGLGAIAVVVAGALLWARRRRDTVLVSLLTVAAVASAVSWYTASKVTTDIVGIAPHQFRFLWPLAAFLTFGVALAAVRLFATPRALRVVTAAAAAGLLVVTVADLPTYAATAGPQLDESINHVQRDLDRQMGAAAKYAPLDLAWDGLRFGEPYSGALMAELRRRNIEFVTRDKYLARQLGPIRASNGHDAKDKIFYRTGAVAESPELGPFTRIAFHDGLNAAQRRRIAVLRRAIGGYLRTHGLRRTVKLQNGINIEIWRSLTGPFDTDAAIQRAFDKGALAGAFTANALDIPAAWRGRFREYARLQSIADLETVGVYVGPVNSKSP
ncbi:MAG: hypothetical protein ABJC79_01735 [Acidimicrobiia bacterium]